MNPYKDNMKNKNEKNSETDKINLDYDWNTEYGDGDIPDVDKNSVGHKLQSK